MQQYTRDGIAPVQTVIDLINAHLDDNRKGERILIGDHPVYVTSLRLRTFAVSGPRCVSCGLNASFFAFEKLKDEEFFHLNLYGLKDDHEILFTHDHRIARSFGGSESLENTQTCCITCNVRKANIEKIIRGMIPKKTLLTPEMLFAFIKELSKDIEITRKLLNSD